jgi:glutaredoxin
MTVPSILRPLAVALGALLVAGTACAQYKIVGPDGKVTYTDKPPVGQATPAASGTGAGATGGSSGSGGLPYETRQAMSRYPVTLYARRGCGACDQARSWLKTRGVPFAEYSIDTEADSHALVARFSQSTLPVVTVGSQVLHGFNATELENTTLAAGYPAQVKLFGYHWPAAVPLAPPVAAAASVPVEAPRPAAPPPPQPKSGIQF